jgi:hypothetical protein
MNALLLFDLVQKLRNEGKTMAETNAVVSEKFGKVQYGKKIKVPCASCGRLVPKGLLTTRSKIKGVCSNCYQRIYADRRKQGL